jgi:hypothetical protein
VSPVRYELGFYIPEDGILHSHRRETSSLTLENVDTFRKCGSIMSNKLTKHKVFVDCD